MAKAFSPKNYFKKIHSPDVLVEFYKRNNVTALFEITESTPRKSAVNIFIDFYNTLTPEQKLDLGKKFALTESLSTIYSDQLIPLILKEKSLPHITELECHSPHDKVLYWYMFNTEVFDDLFFFHEFYRSRSYMLYEAKEIDMTEIDVNISELIREFTRIANKEDNATECDITHKKLDGIFYFTMTFDGSPILTTTKDQVTGEIDKAATRRKKEEVEIVYLPKDKEILISFTGGKYEKLIYLDTFLRIICKSGYEGKEESFDLAPFKEEIFDFKTTNKGVPILTWKIKSVTLTIGGNEKQKKKMKLIVPSSQQEYGVAPLRSTLEELGILSQLKNYQVENLSLSFSFSSKEKADKSVQVSCSLTRNKSSLCPLFPYDRMARTLLKQAHIEKGFIEVAKKEKEEINKKWEV